MRQGRGRGGMPPTVGALIAAVRQVGLVGDETQRQAARGVLEDAARRIYSILADPPVTDPSPSGAITASAEDGTDAVSSGSDIGDDPGIEVGVTDTVTEA